MTNINKSTEHTRFINLNEINDEYIIVQEIPLKVCKSIKRTIESYYTIEDKSIKEELSDSFLDLYNVPITSIISFGDPNDISEQFLESILPFTEFEFTKYAEHTLKIIGKEVKKSVKCYSGLRDYKIPPSIVNGNTIIHESFVSSWKCAMIVLGNPQNVIIYKMKKDGKYINVSNSL